MLNWFMHYGEAGTDRTGEVRDVHSSPFGTRRLPH